MYDSPVEGIRGAAEYNKEEWNEEYPNEKYGLLRKMLQDMYGLNI